MWFVVFFFFIFKQKTAYEMRISDWSSDVCSSDLAPRAAVLGPGARPRQHRGGTAQRDTPAHPHTRRHGRRGLTPYAFAAPLTPLDQHLARLLRRPHPPAAGGDFRPHGFPGGAVRKRVVSGQRVSGSVHLGVRGIIKTNN